MEVIFGLLVYTVFVTEGDGSWIFIIVTIVSVPLLPLIVDKLTSYVLEEFLDQYENTVEVENTTGVQTWYKYDMVGTLLTVVVRISVE